MSLHKKISLFKSGIRIVGYVALLADFTLGISCLITAELLGIAEEWGEK